MRNSILYLKVIVLTLGTVLLAFGIQGIGYSQQTDWTAENLLNTLNAQELPADQVINKALRSVMWIRTPKGGEATGVLINKNATLAVTNAHVTQRNERVEVFFPLQDRKGNLISDRDFYINQSNRAVLVKLGYATSGRVIAENSDMDLAIVSLDGLPETAREIDHDFSYPIYRDMNKDDPVYILGNPGGRALWRPKAGHFQGYTENLLQITADAYFGNSGGPVFNKQGILIGIVSRTNLDTMRTWAVTTKSIRDLLDTLKPRHIFSIKNNTFFTVPYQVKWIEDEEWKQTSLKPGEWATHWNHYSSKASGYPKVRYDSSAADEFLPQVKILGTYTRYFGADIKDRVSRRQDAREYHFGYNSGSKILTLYDSEH